MSCPVTEPPWTVDLPRLRPRPNLAPTYLRLPVLAVAPPGIVSYDPTRSLALGLRRRCAFCGCAVAAPYYQVYFGSEAERAADEYPGGIYATTMGPVHASCAFFSALVCPFMQRPATRRKAPRAKNARGEAAVFSFARYGLFFNSDGRRWIQNSRAADGTGLGVPVRAAPASWGYVGELDCIPFVTPKELLSAYEDALAEDAKTIDVSTRLYWTDSPADVKRLAECARMDRITVATMRSSAAWRSPTGQVAALSLRG